jgi:hypothetical protein
MSMVGSCKVHGVQMRRRGDPSEPHELQDLHHTWAATTTPVLAIAIATIVSVC